MMEIVDVMRDYVTYACDIENRFANTKYGHLPPACHSPRSFSCHVTLCDRYTLLQMLRGRKKLRGKVVEGITRY